MNNVFKNKSALVDRPATLGHSYNLQKYKMAARCHLGKLSFKIIVTKCCTKCRFRPFLYEEFKSILGFPIKPIKDGRWRLSWKINVLYNCKIVEGCFTCILV